MLAKRQREAEARKYELEKEAEAMRTKADAARYQAEQEAAGIRARGEAEAAAIQAKAVAEAEGMEKKAEAYAKYNNAAIVEMLVGIMPQMAARDREAIVFYRQSQYLRNRRCKRYKRQRSQRNLRKYGGCHAAGIRHHVRGHRCGFQGYPESANV